MKRRELLGIVGVDSGQLLVIDPCYIKSQWRDDGQGEEPSIKFWGQGGNDVAKILEEDGHEVVQVGGAYKIYVDEDQADNMVKYIRELSDEIEKTVVTWPQTGSTYEQVCELTCGPNQGGQLNYLMGHAGLGVAFSSGLGDGSYEVYATIQDVPGWGERVTKVEIELIPDWEIEEYEREEGEF